jgi:hypothetical protein
MTLPITPEEELERELGIEWDEIALVYIAATAILLADGTVVPAGAVIAPELVMGSIESIISASQFNMSSLGIQLQGGVLNLAEWQAGMMLEIKTLHTASAAAAKGGWAQMSASDWGYMGSEIKKQYEYLADFAAEIFSGYPLDGRFFQRLDLYGRAARTSASQIFRRLNEFAGKTEERRVLGIADHCNSSAGREGCLELAAKGWQPIGTLAKIGDATCHQNCRCSFEYK